MLDPEKQTNLQKHQFRSYYCLECKQQKSCQLLDYELCCSCFYNQERIKAQQYTNYQQVYQQRQQEWQTGIKQLNLLQEYAGCKRCGSKEVDAYKLYEKNKLVCQPCLVKKKGRSSSPISFAEQSR